MYNISFLTIILVASLGSAGGVRVSSANLNYAVPFNPSGDYHPIKLPNHKTEKFTHFDLEVRRRKGKLVAWGEVKNVGAHYKFAFVSVTEKSLKFTTVSLQGVSYRFEGQFLGRGDFSGQSTGAGIVMLEGTLTKFEHGRKTTEITSPFLYYPGC